MSETGGVAAEESQATTDVLDGGARATRLPPRAGRALLVVLLVALVVGFLVDSRVRARERSALARCSEAVAAATSRANGRVDAMAGYVHVPLAGPLPVDIRRGLLRMVSDSAAGGAAPLRDALATCRGTDVAALHRDLRDRRDRCLRRAADTLAYVDEVVRDGSAAFRDHAGAVLGPC